MLRRSKTERSPRLSGTQGADRIVVVDDLPEAGHLVASLVRHAGYEVAELTDAHDVVPSLVDEPGPVSAVIGSFTMSGTRSGLRLLDSIRSHEDPRIAGLRILLALDEPRQQIFCLQAGADDIVLRPYHATDLIDELDAMLGRKGRDRTEYRARRAAQLQSAAAQPRRPAHDPGAAVVAGR